MRFLIPAASAVLIAVIASSSAVTVSAAGTRAAGTRAAGTRAAGTRAAGIRAAWARSHGQAVPGTVTATGWTATGRTMPAGADTAAAHGGRAAPRGSFVWPLTPRPAVVRRFQPPQAQWAAGHRGVDLSATVGQPVLSAGEGVVAFSGVIAGRGVIVVRHTGGLRTTYGAVDERLASGTVVHRGARIGVVSPAPGHCGPLTCLHWGAIADRANQRTYQDPLSLLGLAQPILLPLG